MSKVVPFLVFLIQSTKGQEPAPSEGETTPVVEVSQKLAFNDLILIVTAAGLLVVLVASIGLMLYCLIKCRKKKAELLAKTVTKTSIRATTSASVPVKKPVPPPPAIVQKPKVAPPPPPTSVKRPVASITKPQTPVKPKPLVKPAEKQQNKKSVTKSSSTKSKTSSRKTSSTTPSKPKAKPKPTKTKSVEKSKAKPREEPKAKEVPKIKEDATQKSGEHDAVQAPVERGRTFAFACFEKREWRKLEDGEADDFSFQIQSGNTFSGISDD